MKIIGGALALALLLGGVAQAEESPADYRHHAPLNVTGDGPWYRVELPVAAHFAVQYGDLRDLRVFDGAGKAQAYALLPGRDETREHEQEHGVRWFPLHVAAEKGAAPTLRVERSTSGTLIELADEQAVEQGRQLRGWLLDASAIDAPLIRLGLDWSGGEEGFQRFSIEASDDLQHWRSWGDGQVARLSFADERIDQRQVELPGQRARYLRLLWQSPSQAPQLALATLRSRRQDSRPAPLVWSEPLPAQRTGDGQLQWQFPSALPVERIRVALTQNNTLAPVRVEGRDDEQRPWRELSSGLLYRLSENGQQLGQDELSLPAWPLRQLRLRVDARGGGLGEQAPTLQVAVRATQLVFLARGEPPYQLALGRSQAASAALPLTTLIPGYQPERLAGLATARVAELDLHPADAAVEDLAAAGDWKRWGLWLVLLLGVGLLALMAFSLLRRPPET